VNETHHHSRRIIVAALLALTGAAEAAQPGCGMSPSWLCYMNSTWWQGPSEAEARAHILAVCKDGPKQITCRDGGAVITIKKD
jgi:hypothetical protein